MSENKLRGYVALSADLRAGTGAFGQQGSVCNSHFPSCPVLRLARRCFFLSILSSSDLPSVFALSTASAANWRRAAD